MLHFVIVTSSRFSQKGASCHYTLSSLQYKVLLYKLGAGAAAHADQGAFSRLIMDPAPLTEHLPTADTLTMKWLKNKDQRF